LVELVKNGLSDSRISLARGIKQTNEEPRLAQATTATADLSARKTLQTPDL
jgi:hypothetical protein